MTLTELDWSRYRPQASFCVHGNERSVNTGYVYALTKKPSYQLVCLTVKSTPMNDVCVLLT
jgi:hypothetical protein